MSYNPLNYDMTGFGNPFTSNEDPSMGFGDIDELCYGSPEECYSIYVFGIGADIPIIATFIGGELEDFGQKGGKLVKIYADWGQLIPNTKYPGPFKVYVSDGITEILCYSALPGFPQETYANNLGNYIAFSLPAGLDLGTYDIKVYYDIDYSKSIEILGAINIKKDLRDNNTVQIKKNMPLFYEVGNRGDHGWTNTEYSQGDVLESILEVLGEELSTIIPSKYTVLTQDLSYLTKTINVESTLDFPQIGIIKIGEDEIEYVSKNDTSFTTLYPVKQVYRKYDRVSLINTNIEKIDNYYLRKVYNYNKPKTFDIKQSQWDDTFKYLQFAETYAMPILYNYFSNLTRHVDFEKVCVLSDDNTFIILDETEEFNESHVDRFIEIQQKVYYAKELVSDIPHISDPGILVKGLKLCEIDTAYWEAADFQMPIGSVPEYTVKVKPYNIIKDYNCEFVLNYEKSIFGTTGGFIDKDFINNEGLRGIYFDSYEGIGENNFLELLATGIAGKIFRKAKAQVGFGTYINNALDPNIGLSPDNEFAP
jgi:hypothetical protein